VYGSLVRKRLPVWAVVKRSYGYVWDHRILLAIPLLLVFVVNLVSGIYLRNLATTEAPPPQGVVWLTGIAVIVFSMTVVVGIHRTVLLDEARPGVGFLRLDGNLLRYIGAWLLLMVLGILFAVITLLLVMIAAMVGGLAKPQSNGPAIALATLAIIFAVGALFLRFMLALPAAAVGSQDGLGVSWTATRGNWLRLLAAVILTLLPFIIIDILLVIPTMRDAAAMLRAGVQKPIEQPLGLLVATALIKSIDLAVLTVMLSLSYDVLVRGGGPTDLPPMAVRS
jgi:hypothetical protein